MSFEARRYHDISCGHRVHGHESKCAHLHGHNYRIHFVCVAENGGRHPIDNSRISELDKIGRVIDFGIIKEKLCMWVEQFWDHSFLMWDRDPALDSMIKIDPLGIWTSPFNPTAENMAEFLVNTIGPIVLRETGVTLKSVTIEETAKCWATYTLE